MCQHKVYLFQTCGHAVISQPPISRCADFERGDDGKQQHDSNSADTKRASNCSGTSVYSTDVAKIATTTAIPTPQTQCPNIQSHPLHTLRVHTLCAVCLTSRSERLNFFEKEQLRGFEEGIKARKREWWEDSRRVVRRRVSDGQESRGSTGSEHEPFEFELAKLETRNSQPTTTTTTTTKTTTIEESGPSTPPLLLSRRFSPDFQLSRDVYKPPYVRHNLPSPALSPDPHITTFPPPMHSPDSFHSPSHRYSTSPFHSAPTPAKHYHHRHTSSSHSVNYNPPPTPAYSIASTSSTTDSSSTDLSSPRSPVFIDSCKSWLSGDIRIRGSGRRSAVFGSENIRLEEFEIPEQIREEEEEVDMTSRFGGSEQGRNAYSSRNEKRKMQIGRGRKSAGDAEGHDRVGRWRGNRERVQTAGGFF